MTGDPTPPAPAHTAPAPPASTDVGVMPADDTEVAAPTYGRGSRAMFAFVAVMCLVITVILGIGGSWLLAASMIVFGGVMGYFAVTGRQPADPMLAPASRRFHELADPSRPLTPDDTALPGDRAGGDAPRTLK